MAKKDKRISGISRRGLMKGTAAGLALTGSGPFLRSAYAQDAKTINVLTLADGIFGQPFVELSPEFTKATGIKVNNITMGYNEAIQKQVAAFAAGSNAYDVVQVDYIFAKGYAKAGHLAPLEGLVSSDAIADYSGDVPQSFIEMYSFEDKLFGMATIGNCQRFIYNSGHLKAAGLDVPQTWDDLLSSAQKVVSAPDNRFGFVAGTERLAKAFGVWLPIFWANGGVLFDDEMKPVFNDATGVGALEFLLELVKTMPPGGAAYTESDEIKAMATGLGTLDPVAWIPDSITTASEGVTLETALSPKGSVTNAPVMGGLGLVVSKYANDASAAAEYVAWFNSKDVQSDMIVQHGGQPCRNSAWAANANAKPWFPALAENLRAAKVRPQLPEMGEIDGAVGVQLSKAFVGEATPKEAMDAAQQAVDQIMKDAGYY